MSDEPRRSGRATKGQHTKASSSPAPSATNSAKDSKPAAKSTGKKGKGAKKAQQETEDNEDEDGGEEDVIRCICGNKDPNDPRPFIGCEACLVWQHNVCMGEPVDDDEVPEHYFCEQCRPEEHVETLRAIEEGRKIWEERDRKWRAWKKMSAARKKSKGRQSGGGDEVRPTWLKAEITKDEDAEEPTEPVVEQEAGSKRKRESAVKPEPAAIPTTEEEQPPANGRRPDKRRKSTQPVAKLDPDTAVVPIEQLPSDRKRIADVLAKVIIEDITTRVKAKSYALLKDQTAKRVGEKLGTLVEYALYQNHGGPTQEAYKLQFKDLNANLKRNKVLIERLLEDSLTPDELAVMESKDMASEEQQLERKKMKEELDRQAVAVQEEGPMYRQSHKGIEKVEDERMDDSAFTAPQPVRERTSVAEGEGSPPAAGSPTVDVRRPSAAPAGADRRTSSQQFDMSQIWSKTGTAQSPTIGGPRPMQMPPRRRSSVQIGQADGAKEDADIDRMLQDDDEVYEPQDFGDGEIVWRGKLIHAGEGEPTVNARFVAGRDLAPTVPWDQLMPTQMSVDGRLAIAKAEEYLCGLQWSTNSDVTVLAFSPYDDAAAFNTVFEYFKSRDRYAVINKDKPRLAKDLYIVPVEKGAESLPEHVQLLEHNTIKLPVEDRILLASMVVHRNPVNGQGDGAGSASVTPKESVPANGGQQALPQHMRGGGAGPSGSPLAANAPTFSPQTQQQPPVAGYGALSQQPGAFPPNPYSPQQPQQVAVTQQQNQYLPPNYPMIQEILGPRQWDSTAQQILQADPNMVPEKLRNLRRILDEDVAARTDLMALGARLQG